MYILKKTSMWMWRSEVMEETVIIKKMLNIWITITINQNGTTHLFQLYCGGCQGNYITLIGW